MYFYGFGTNRNLQLAVTYFLSVNKSTVSDSSYANMMYTLGRAFEYSFGVERNLETAKKYYLDAVECGCMEAVSSLQRLNK